MRNEIKIFESPEFGRIRTVSDERGEPWFCLADVCKVLGLKQNGVVMRLEKGVISTEPLSTRGGTQMANFVSEDGLYDVILDSRKPSARAFRKWVTSEVLPQIRRRKLAYSLSLLLGGVGFVMAAFVMDKYLMFVPFLLIG